MSQPVLDLTVYHWRKERGDLVIFATWYGENLDEAEPCLILMPRHYNGAKPCGVALSEAYRYYDPQSGHRYLLAKAREFNQVLGRADSATNVYQVADAIHDHLQELIEIPPKPVTGRRHHGEIKVTDRSSGRSRTIEVHEDV